MLVSVQSLTGPAPQILFAQRSFSVHGLPSLHGAEFAGWTQPVAGSQVSSVHGLPSPHEGGGPPLQMLLPQTSFVVHALSSSQGNVFGAYTHPVAGLHESVVHTLPSLQPIWLPAQTPARQASPVVQAFPSSQSSLLFVWTHPVAGLQASSVQTFVSLQFLVAPTQEPAAHVSPTVQALPSSHGAVLLEWTQPDAGLHVSFVHTSPSLQSGPGPPWHEPPAQVSAVVHSLPSSQGALLFTWVQPDEGSQPSSVQPFESSQAVSSLMQACATQRSFVVHSSVSAHSELRLQQSAIGECVQPDAGLHESPVQKLSSSQSAAGPP